MSAPSTPETTQEVSPVPKATDGEFDELFSQWATEESPAKAPTIDTIDKWTEEGNAVDSLFEDWTQEATGAAPAPKVDLGEAIIVRINVPDFDLSSMVRLTTKMVVSDALKEVWTKVERVLAGKHPFNPQQYGLYLPAPHSTYLSTTQPLATYGIKAQVMSVVMLLTSSLSWN